MRQSNTTFVNLRAALDDLDPLVETAKPATKNLAPFLGELRPVLSKAVPVFQELPPQRRAARASPTTPPKRSASCPPSRSAPRKAFPHAEQAIEDFQPNLNFARAYTPDIFNGFGKLGQITGYYDGNGHYARAQLVLNLFKRNSGSGELEPITPSEQYDAFGGSAGVAAPLPRRRHPAGAGRLQPLHRTALRRLRRKPIVRMRPGRRATRTMRKWLLAAGLVAAIVAVVVLLAGGGNGSSGYVVRGDLRQRRLHGQGRGSAGRRRHRRRNRIGRRDDAGRGRQLRGRQAAGGPRQGRDRDEDRRPRLPGLPQRRQLPDPAAVADRREVRRLPPDPAARPGLQAGRRR